MPDSVISGQNDLADGEGINIEPQELWHDEDDRRGGLPLPLEPGQTVVDGITQYWCMKEAGVDMRASGAGVNTDPQWIGQGVTDEAWALPLGTPTQQGPGVQHGGSGVRGASEVTRTT